MNLSMLNCLEECIEDEECRKYLISKLKDYFTLYIREHIDSCVDPP